jgi:hypothetical protein
MLPRELIATIEASLTKALNWLLAQQADDGGWHSTTYGTLKAGAGLSALTAYTLSRIPNPPPAWSEAMERTARFLSAGFPLRKVLSAPDGTLDYPTYAAGLLLSAGKKFPVLLDQIPRAELIQYLLAAQVGAERGFEENSNEYGGWDLLGRDDARGISTGTNVSVMAFVLEALQPVEQPAANQARKLALAWLDRAQTATGDGGFPFTAVPDSLNNKARWCDEQHRMPRSYGSATCDGLRCRLACGQTVRDEPVKRALQWITEKKPVEYVPGFEHLAEENSWSQGLRFYYLQSLARVFPFLPVDIANQRAEQVAEFIIGSQRNNGSWVNESTRMREDDPLIATNFAILTLAELIRA